MLVSEEQSMKKAWKQESSQFFEFTRGAGDPNRYTGVIDWRHHPIYLIVLLFYQLL